MVVVPAGSFMMGTPYSRDTVGREKPQHEVTFSRPFAVARHAVTHGQFAAFINNTNYRLTGGAHVPKDRVFLRHDPNASWLYPGFPQDDSHPVVCVNWHDANAYTAWLAQTAGKPYRLLSEAEREYVARAGTGTPFWWGASITRLRPITTQPGRPMKVQAPRAIGAGRPSRSAVSRRTPGASTRSTGM
jgi:formylglycine-generating enzyme required for sulfatase activity